jgi:molybdenum cofactor biosynthesis protein B
MIGPSHHAELPKDLKFMIIITSDTIISKMFQGEPFTDVSGEVAAALIQGSGFRVVGKTFLPNDADSIRDEVRKCISSGSDIIIISGGTGISRKDVSVEAVKPLLEKELPGFGELFRRISYESVGTSAIASRAIAGAVGNCLLFALPGSPEAVKLALQKIILPEAPHLIKMARG